MKTTNYIHVNTETKVDMSVNSLNSTGNTTLNISAGLSDLSLFLAPEQLLQLHETLGAYIQANPNKFVNKSISKLEEVKND